ncbi:LCP family protein [Viridibacillus sp. FSL R5-0477]|uniref:Membrane-bound protein n=1 Tax=Viridibacillus arenosi FSL R5-213 TaxID=1227360 RepID=W4F1P9_9BACL|nr:MULTISPECIES: LCP family protein [Viridibacillus]ETT86384.1 membrane-bound protein [Viridibacillus arenosi FSL R5-213]
MEEKKWYKQKKYQIILGIVLLLVLGVGGYAFSLYNSFNSALDNMHHPVDKTDKRENDISIKKQDPFSVLLLGVDERANDSGRSDTMIVLSVNPKEESVKMLSIPRDTKTEIVGNGTVEKINHAYARGGAEMAIATVENFLDIPIDYYVKVNMEGFKDIIDTLNGVTVVNDMDLTYKNYHFPKGEIELNGKEALIFSRIRYEDPRGDFGRQIRQKQLIQAVLDKGTNLSSLLKIDDILGNLGDNIKTNFTLKEMLNIQKQYKSLNKNIEQIQFEKGSGGKEAGVWYYYPDANELSEIKQTFKGHLLLK